MVIHSEKALAPFLARQFYRKLAGPKAELWLESKGQTDFYDDPTLIATTSDAIAKHFRSAMS